MPFKKPRSSLTTTPHQSNRQNHNGVTHPDRWKKAHGRGMFTVGNETLIEYNRVCDMDGIPQPGIEFSLSATRIMNRMTNEDQPLTSAERLALQRGLDNTPVTAREMDCRRVETRSMAVSAVGHALALIAVLVLAHTVFLPLEQPIRTIDANVLNRFQLVEVLLPEPKPETPHVETVQAPKTPVDMNPVVETPPLDAKAAPETPQSTAAKTPTSAKRAKKRPRRTRKTTPRPSVARVVEDSAIAPAVLDPSAHANTYEEASSTPVGEDAVPTPVPPVITVSTTPTVDTAALLRGYIGRVTRAIHRKYQYPARADRMGLEGRVLIEIIVDGGGAIVGTQVVQSSGHAILDQAALRSIRSVGKMPSPPSALGWTRRSLRIPFVYQLRS
jgi:protein TonB